MDLTSGNGDEREVLAASLQPDRVYVLDRGYVKFRLFRDIVNVGSSLVCRVYDNTAFETIEERALSEDTHRAGIVRDAVVRFTGPSAIQAGLDRPMRIVKVEGPKSNVKSQKWPISLLLALTIDLRPLTFGLVYPPQRVQPGRNVSV